jgi:hypothetical protein
MRPANSSNKLWRRRDVIKLLGATAITGPVILRGTTANAATSKVIKIGYVSSQTGVLAPLAEADPFILDQIRTALAKGITNGGVSYKVQIINKDSQSNTNRGTHCKWGVGCLCRKRDLLTAGAPWQPEALLAEALVIGHPEGAGAGVRAFFMGGPLFLAGAIRFWPSILKARKSDTAVETTITATGTKKYGLLNPGLCCFKT